MPRSKSDPSGSSVKPDQRSVIARAGNNSKINTTLGTSRKKANKSFRFSRYIFRVLNQIHPTLSLTNKAMKVMDDFMLDVYTRLVTEAAGLVKVSGKATLSASEFQTATKLLLPGELSKHAVNEATKAVSHFMKSKADDINRKKTRLEIEIVANPTEEVDFENETTEEDIEEIPAPTKKTRLVPETAVASKGSFPEPSPSKSSLEHRPTVIQSGKSQPEKVIEEVISSSPESLSTQSTPEMSPVVSRSQDGRAESVLGSVLLSAPSPTTLQRILNETPKDQTEQGVSTGMLADNTLTVPISGSVVTQVTVTSDLPAEMSSTNQNLTFRAPGKDSSETRSDFVSSDCETLPFSQDSPSRATGKTGLETPPASRDSTPWKVDPNRSSEHSTTTLDQVVQTCQFSRIENANTCSTIVELTSNPEQERCKTKVTIKCTKMTTTSTTTTTRSELD